MYLVDWVFIVKSCVFSLETQPQVGKHPCVDSTGPLLYSEIHFIPCSSAIGISSHAKAISSISCYLYQGELTVTFVYFPAPYVTVG